MSDYNLKDSIQVRVDSYARKAEDRPLTEYERGRLDAYLLVLGKIKNGADWIPYA